VLYFENLLSNMDQMLTVDCRRKLCGYFDELFSIYNSAVIGEGSLKVSAGDSLHVVEAFRYIGYLRISI
jgi:hypothetical protein